MSIQVLPKMLCCNEMYITSQFGFYPENNDTTVSPMKSQMVSYLYQFLCNRKLVYDHKPIIAYHIEKSISNQMLILSLLMTIAHNDDE